MTEGILRAADLYAAGYDKSALRRMVRAGVLVRLCRGAYTRVAPEDAAAAHRLIVRAVLADLADGAVASHVSAAALHGLPTWGLDLGRVHVTFGRRSGGRRDDRLYVHTAPLAPEDVIEVGGLSVTSWARTAVDLARTTGFEAAVAVADAALRARRWTPSLDAVRREQLAVALGRARGWPNVAAARQVVAFADGRAESVGESRSRVAIARAGLPPPELQWPVRHRDGTAYADFGWPRHRTVGEFDGKVKYGRLLRPGQTPADAVYEEKLREDAIRDEDLGVARWGWADLTDFAPTAARIRGRFRA